MYSEKDLAQLKAKNLSPKIVDRHISYFKDGIDFVNIQNPATPGKGISVLDDSEIQRYVDLFDTEIHDYTFTRFIPASGAASRMFKFLFELNITNVQNPNHYAFPPSDSKLAKSA